MSKTKIVVLRMKEVVYTAVFVGIGVLLLIVLFFMFGRQNSPKSESTQSTINNESSTYKNDAIYRAGIYESQFVIGEKTINLEVALDEEQVKSVKVKNLDESVETMYPLMKSAVKDVSKQLSAGVSIDEVVLSKNSMYTEKLILDAVKAEIVGNLKIFGDGICETYRIVRNVRIEQ